MPPLTPITNIGEALLVSLTAALSAFFAFLPGLLGALLLLVLGWLIAGLVARLIERGLRALNFERAVSRAGAADFLSNTGSNWTASRVVAELVKWFVFLIFVQAAANVLGMPQVTQVINSVVLFIPNVIVALAILIFGSLVANVLSGLVRASATDLGLDNAALLSSLTRYAIVGFAIVAAVDQLGIAETVVYTLLIGLIGAIALAIGLAFGLGGRDVAAQITQSWYTGSQEAARKLQAAQAAQPVRRNGIQQPAVAHTPATYVPAASAPAAGGVSPDSPTESFRTEAKQPKV